MWVWNRIAPTAFLALLWLGATGDRGWASTNAPAGRSVDQTLLPEGRYVYERNCLVCHGRWGDGKGEMAEGMWPRPRKFSLGLFKYRSTPSGSLPTDADLERSIRSGLYGTSMPAFQQLSDREVKTVSEYVKSFSSRWNRPESYGVSLPIPPPPSWLEDDVERRVHVTAGREGFEVNCLPCHGPGGKGDGPVAASLEDNWGFPARPPDLTLPSIRSGPGPRDLYRVLLTGLDGTPMPSFLEATTEKQRWELVAFLLSLR